MALPTITAYELPTEGDLPTNRVDWTLDPQRAAVLVHDLQNHFVSAFPADDQPLNPMLANVARTLDWAREAGVPVAYSAQPGGQSSTERGLQLDFWGPGLPAETEAGAIVPTVEPQPGDTVITKWKYSAFVRTELDQWLRERRRDQLVIVGVYAHIGVLMTAADAWMRDIQAFVVADAVADFSADEHQMAMNWASGRCAVVTHTDAVVGRPGAAGPSLTSDLVRRDVAAALGVAPEEVPADESLVEHGLDSMRVMNLAEQWRTTHGAEIDFASLAERPTLGAWTDLLVPA